MIDREAVYAALFERIEAAMTGYYATRDLVPASQCQRWPAVILTAGDQVVDEEDGDTTPTVWRLGAVANLYLQRPISALPFEPEINAAIDLLVNALDPQAGEATYGRTAHTTLDDACESARVRGTIEIFRQPDDQRAVVVIPIEMLAYQ